MDAFLELPAERRRQLCTVAGESLGLDAPSVEKDFWVCWVLRELFALPKSGPRLTFKGGTSLSKGWKLIERFSEDIDAVIDREFLGFGGKQAPERASSNKKRGERIDALMTACRNHIREIMSPEFRQRLEQRLPAGLSWRMTDDPSDNDGQTCCLNTLPCFQRGLTFARW